MVGGHSSHSYLTGTNLYFEFAYIVKDKDPQAVEDEYFRILTINKEETLRYGGSIAHHHGSGKYRTKKEQCIEKNTIFLQKGLQSPENSYILKKL